ncbi:hypothetical protein IWW36_000754 [Coemansia brasiliensis]|uniref:Uncharacterized protein n=1 Tax=Coemansia brasiliensis TaxID=2650707 RepID=A0A9W8M1F0_9FUNG|nr:hypothetical protein IWW36_000754 [Coemansia brasiliensis]
MDNYKRDSYDKVGDYLYSQDLCVGVFDGTNFNSATCIRSKLNPPSNQFPADTMVIRNNTVRLNYDYLATALYNLTSDTQAQCVMTSEDTTACWVWDSDMKRCFNRHFYQTNRYVSSDDCHRTEPIPSRYAVYVRLENFESTL